MFKDKELREQLKKAGLVDHDGWVSSTVTRKLDAAMEGTQVDKLKAEVNNLRDELDALYELLGVTRESAGDSLVKGKKTVAIKKPLVW